MSLNTNSMTPEQIEAYKKLLNKTAGVLDTMKFAASNGGGPMSTALNIDPSMLGKETANLTMPTGFDAPFAPADLAAHPIVGESIQAPQMALTMNGAKAAPGVIGRAGNMLKSPLGMAGSLATLAMTDWDDPKSVGSSLGGIGGGALGGAIAGGGGAAGGAAAGAAAGSVVPVVGTILGGLAGSVGGSALGGLFGKSKEEKEAEKAKKEAEMNQLLDNMRTVGDYLQRSNQEKYAQMKQIGPVRVKR